MAIPAVRRQKNYASDAERVAFLFELYQRYTSLLPAAKPAKPAKPAKRIQPRSAAPAN